MTTTPNVRAMKLKYLPLIAVLATTGCAKVRSVVPGLAPPPPEDPEVVVAREREDLRSRLVSTPHGARAATEKSEPIRESALTDRKLRILVSTDARALWLMQGDSVVFLAPVAIGMEKDFTWAGKTYDFDTPHSKRKVLSKAEMPLWVPPDWHYFEIAAERNLLPVHLKKTKDIHKLQDSTRIEVRGRQVGRVNQFGNFWAFTPGSEIIFEGKIFIPPLDSEQRRVPAVLGTHKLEIGNGYLIHGTDKESSIGAAVSHGCVRMYNQDVAHLYAIVPVGTPVYIF